MFRVVPAPRMRGCRCPRAQERRGRAALETARGPRGAGVGRVVAGNAASAAALSCALLLLAGRLLACFADSGTGTPGGWRRRACPACCPCVLPTSDNLLCRGAHVLSGF